MRILWLVTLIGALVSCDSAKSRPAPPAVIQDAGACCDPGDNMISFDCCARCPGAPNCLGTMPFVVWMSMFSYVPSGD